MKKLLYCLIIISMFNMSFIKSLDLFEQDPFENIFGNFYIVADNFDQFDDNIHQNEFEDLNDLATNFYKEGENFIIEMSLPGINNIDDINIYIKDGILTVSGKGEEEKEEKDKHFYSKEINKGAFERSLSLPENIDETKAVTTYKNGILKIVLPIKPEDKGIKLNPVIDENENQEQVIGFSTSQENNQKEIQ